MRSREAWPESDESRYDFAGRGVIVTGAAAGIGRAIAHAFARCGADLLLVDIDAPELARCGEALRGAPGRDVTLVGDVAEPSTSQRILELGSGLAAVDLGLYGIRVNAIAPAAYRDPPVARSDVPLGRAATARTVGEAALFLASEAAAATTGHVLPVDGGLLAQLRPGADSGAFEKGRS